MKPNRLQRRRNRRPLIIESSPDVPRAVHVFNRLLTVLLWLFYFYLIRDAFLFFYDILRWLLLREQPPDMTDFYSALNWVGSYLLLVFISSLLFIAWARYNWLRFHGKDRRKTPAPVSNARLAEFFHVTEREVDQWQQQPLITMNESLTRQQQQRGIYPLPVVMDD